MHSVRVHDIIIENNHSYLSFQLIVVAITMLRRRLTLSTRHTHIPDPKYVHITNARDTGNGVMVHRTYIDGTLMR